MVLTVAGLQACAWAPGQNMGRNELASAGVADAAHYQLVSITPQQLSAMAAETVSVPKELLDYIPGPYRIDAGDTLNITVWEHPELTIPAGQQVQAGANGRLVRADGTLFYPYAGVITARGMTLEDLRGALTVRLSKLIKDPQVDVSVNAYGTQRVTLGGAFRKTDPLPVTVTPLTLAQALGAAGVDTLQADLSDLVLTRDGRQYHLDLDALGQAPAGFADIWLKAGDQIFLPYNDRKEVYVLGEVMKPAAIPFKTTGMTLTQVLGRSGGLNQTTAKGKAVYVIRGIGSMEKTPATIYQLDAKSPASFTLASGFNVKAGDVVFVGAAGITRWNRFLTQLLPLTGVITSVKQNSNL